MPAEKNAALATYLRYVLDTTGLSAPQIAKASGISPSTITRFLNSPSYHYNPSNSTISKIHAATGINPAPFYAARNPIDEAAMHLTRDDLFDERWQGFKDQIEIQKSYGNVPIVGLIEAGKWQDINLVTTHSVGTLPITFSKYKAGDIFAGVVRGKSISKLAREEDLLVCASVSLNQIVEDGHFVVIERRLKEGLREITARMVKLDEDKRVYFLTYASDDTRFSEVLELGPADSGPLKCGSIRNDQFKVLGNALFVWGWPRIGRAPFM